MCCSQRHVFQTSSGRTLPSWSSITSPISVSLRLILFIICLRFVLTLNSFWVYAKVSTVAQSQRRQYNPPSCFLEVSATALLAFRHPASVPLDVWYDRLNSQGAPPGEIYQVVTVGAHRTHSKLVQDVPFWHVRCSRYCVPVSCSSWHVFWRRTVKRILEVLIKWILYLLLCIEYGGIDCYDREVSCHSIQTGNGKT